MSGEDGFEPKGRPRWFWPTLLGLVTVALVVRVLFATLVAPDLPPASDSAYYRQVAERLSSGLGYSVARGIGTGAPGPTASHPPGLTLVLAGLDTVGLRSWPAHRIALSLVGALGIGLLGLLGRRLGGPAIGLGAAAVGALHPLWFQHAGMVVSEALYLPLVAGALLLAVRCLDRPTNQRFASLGAVLALLVLTRSEAVVLVLLLGGLTGLLARARWRDRALATGMVLITYALVVSPWLIRNAVTLGAPTLSTNRGGTLAGANCGASVSGGGRGSFALRCAYGGAGAVLFSPPPPGGWDEVSVDRELTARTTDRVLASPGELPPLVATRVLRTFGLYRPNEQLVFDRREGRQRGAQRAGQILHWLLLPLAFLGAVLLPREWRRRWSLLLAPVAAAILTAATVYGSTRIRVVAEPSIALFASAALVLAGRGLLALRRGRPARAGASR